jgi:hypothetical protein
LQNSISNSTEKQFPKEILKRMHEEWDPEKECLPESLTPDDIKRAKESYYLTSTKAVLDIISDEIK